MIFIFLRPKEDVLMNLQASLAQSKFSTCNIIIYISIQNFGFDQFNIVRVMLKARDVCNFFTRSGITNLDRTTVFFFIKVLNSNNNIKMLWLAQKLNKMYELEILSYAWVNFIKIREPLWLYSACGLARSITYG